MKRFFFEKKNQETLMTLVVARGAVVASGFKVFFSFCSQKEVFFL
jgi:hypothetical protein